MRLRFEPSKHATTSRLATSPNTVESDLWRLTSVGGYSQEAHWRSASSRTRIRLHDIRHSYATAALKTGVHPKIVSQRLGHASVAFTLSVYSHAIPGTDRDAADTIAPLVVPPDDDDEQSTEPPR